MFQTCFIHSSVSEASTIFQLIIFLTLAENSPGKVLYKCVNKDQSQHFEGNNCKKILFVDQYIR